MLLPVGGSWKLEVLEMLVLAGNGHSLPLAMEWICFTARISGYGVDTTLAISLETAVTTSQKLKNRPVNQFTAFLEKKPKWPPVQNEQFYI